MFCTSETYIQALCLVPVKQRILQHYVSKTTYITTLCFENNVCSNIMFGTIKQRILQHHGWNQ